MALFRCEVEASWLKSFLRFYLSLQDEFDWIFTDKHIEGKVMNGNRCRMMEFRLFPLEYYARDVPSRVWIYGRVEHFIDSLKRYKIRDLVPFEVKEDGTFWVGAVQVGSTISEEDVSKDVYMPPSPEVKADADLRVVVKDFKRIVDSAKSLGRTEDLRVGFSIKGREGTAIFYNYMAEEKFSRLDIKPYETWLLEMNGIAQAIYSYEFFSGCLVLGLADTVKITFMNESMGRMLYSGNFFDVGIIIAPGLDVKEGMETFRGLLEKKPPARVLAWVFSAQPEEMKLLKDVLVAVNSIFRGDEIWFGFHPAMGVLWVYWRYYDMGYFQIGRYRFEEFHDEAGTFEGSFSLRELTSWIRDVEKLECYVEGEGEKRAVVLVGKGEKIATKEMRGESFSEKLDVPLVKANEIFRGDRTVLSDVFADASAAEDAFLLFITTTSEIRVVGADLIYYSASLPLDGFQVGAEDFIPVSGNHLKGLSEFFSRIPSDRATLGKVNSDLYIGAMIRDWGYELKAMIVQTEEEVETAVAAYKKETKRPAPPPPEAKPLAPPSPVVHVEVRILKDLPEIIGADLKPYGPYKVGEMAWLPKENADALVKQGAAEYPAVVTPEDKRKVIEQIVENCKFWKSNICKTETMLKYAAEKGVKDPQAVLNELLREGMAFEPKPGYVGLTEPEKYGLVLIEVKPPPAIEKPKPKFSKRQKVMYQGILFDVTDVSKEPPYQYTLLTPDRAMFRSYVPEAELTLAEEVKPPTPTRLTESDLRQIQDYFLMNLEDSGVANPREFLSEMRNTINPNLSVEENMGLMDDLIEKIAAREQAAGRLGIPVVPGPIEVDVKKEGFRLVVDGGLEFDETGKAKGDLDFVLLMRKNEWERPLFGVFGVKPLLDALVEGPFHLDLVEDMRMAFGNEWDTIREQLALNPPPFNQYSSFTITWRPEDIEYTETAKKNVDIYNYEYKREDLEAMSLDPLKAVAKIKNVTGKTKEELVGNILAAQGRRGAEALAAEALGEVEKIAEEALKEMGVS